MIRDMASEIRLRSLRGYSTGSPGGLFTGNLQGTSSIFGHVSDAESVILQPGLGNPNVVCLK